MKKYIRDYLEKLIKAGKRKTNKFLSEFHFTCLIRILLLYVVFSTIFASSAVSVFAHVLQTDGSIGAVMHIDPDDDPIAGSISTIYLEIKDKQSKFSPKKCNCSVTISENNQKIYSADLFRDARVSNLSPFFTYTFPQKNVYKILINGIPQNSADFQKFSLVYAVRVDRQVNQSGLDGDSQNSFWIKYSMPVFFVCGLVIFFGILTLVNRRRKLNEK